jgi:hypothetical protein
LYALEEIEQNFEWLAERLKGLGGMLKTTQERECGLIVGVLEDYVLFDCPGQVEIFTHHSSLRNIFFKLQKLGYRVRAHFPEQEFPRHG